MTNKKKLSVIPWLTGMVYAAQKRGGMVCDTCGVELRVGESLTLRMIPADIPENETPVWECDECAGVK